MIGTTILHGEFLRREKIELLDQQVRDTATALLDSELGDLRKIEFEHVEKILSEELGETRIGKFFVIRNNAGKMLFESSGAKLLQIPELPREPQWITIQQKGQYIRILNLKLPRIDDRTLQVGVIIGEDLLAPRYFSKANLFFTSAIMAIGLLVAWALTSFLMQPISKLSKFVSLAAREPSQKLELPSLPPDLKRIVEKSRKNEELATLLEGLETLIARVNRDYQMTRFWSYQMAHELKTPMALIEARVASAQNQKFIPDDLAREILTEVFEISETITTFLTWAEVENSSRQKRLFVLRSSKILADVKARLEASYPGRIELNIVDDFSVMANIQHLEQCLSNLIVNALNYSPVDKQVWIKSEANAIKVCDNGPGIPKAVLERLGEPFNKGESSTGSRKGTGLGLALVHSICRLYQWKIEFQSTGDGTCAVIVFPNLIEEHRDPA